MAVYGVPPMLPGGSDEDLLMGLSQNKSQNASQLQAAQAAMGGLGQAAPGASGANSPRPPSMLQKMFESRRQEAEGIETQQQGLLLGQRLLQVLDPRLPKPARQFLFRELSAAVGVDPKGERAKQLGQMITSLQPEVLEGMRRNVAEQVQANPGEVRNLVRGVFTGQVPIDRIISTMTTAAPTTGSTGTTGGGAPGATRLGGPTEAQPSGLTGGGGVTGAGALGAGALVNTALQLVTPNAPGRPGDTRTPPSGAPDRVPFTHAPPPAGATPPERQVAPMNREIAPELAGILGLDQTERYRNRDVMGAGWRRIPSSYEDQQKLANDIRGAQHGAINTMLLASQLTELVRGRPEVLDAVRFRIPGTDNLMSLNPSSLADQVGNFVQGLGTVLGAGRPPSREEIDRFIAISRGPSSEDTPALTRAINRVVAHLAETGTRVGDTAEVASRVRGIIVPLAFQMAAARGQSGRFLSDRDVELMLNEIGISASPRQMEASIRDMVRRIHDDYNIRMRTHTGADVPLEPGIGQEIADILFRGGITPQPLLDRMYGPGVATERAPPRNALTEGTRVDTSESVLSVPEGRRLPPLSLPGNEATTRYSRIPPTTSPPPPPTELGPGEAGTTGEGVTGRAPGAPRILEYQPRRITRTPGATIQQEEEDTRRRTEEDRAAVLEHRTIERGRFELARSAEERAARTEERTVEEMRRKRIQEAFQALSRALTSSQGSITIPSGGGGSQDQDAAAFRLSPAPQRRAPEPIDASRFQLRR